MAHMDSGITQVDHLGIYVTDLEAAIRFWRDVVGLECSEIESHPEHDLRLAHVVVNGVELELIEAPIEKTQLRHLPHPSPGLYHVGLRTDDLAATVARLRAAGVRMIDETPREGGGMRVQFTAPEGPGQGVMIEVVERLRPAPADEALARSERKSR